MAYSDYGGYAYRNGERVEERSDATITPDGDTFGTPGCWPGFAMIAAGVPHDEVQKRIEWPSGHAVLGDGPVYLVLRKTYATLYRGPEAQDLPIGRDDYDADEVRRMVELDGCKVELIYTQEDNYYVYARLTQAQLRVVQAGRLPPAVAAMERVATSSYSATPLFSE